MADLTDIPTEDLVKEMHRRLSCQSKPEKHVILIGRYPDCLDAKFPFV
jgi:hypothetical protein